jgi:hypothetical protein
MDAANKAEGTAFICRIDTITLNLLKKNKKPL